LTSWAVGYSKLELGNKTLEYIALGLPLAISRWSSHEDYLPEDSVTYFRPGNAEDIARAILAMYGDPADAQQRAVRAGEIFDRCYCARAQREIYLGLYSD
jgi:hypothetical protein